MEILFSARWVAWAGIAYTGWSWAPLFGDYDNNGYKDILITNGYPAAVNNFDYLVEQAQSTSSTPKEEYQQLKNTRELKLRNYLFRNNGGIAFSDVSEHWGFVDSTYSYGMAQGDLDIVINNLNTTASIYQNNVDEFSGTRYLTLKLKGPENNRQGIGANAVLTADGSPDIVAGNLGHNHRFTTSEARQFSMFAHDFDNDYTQDLIYTVNENGTYYPFFGKARLGWAIPIIDEKYPTYRSFSAVDMAEIFGSEVLEKARQYKADIFTGSPFF
ncbi:MAG: hypothetical protein U5K69_06780 [Balneolaceae bacterium]|nr:hypothetical protein [Balneolaceae bacterium]